MDNEVIRQTGASVSRRHTSMGALMEYRVIDLLTETIDPEPKTVTAHSPEKAAELVLGLSLVRSGQGRDLRARVYSQQPGQPMSMVRLYTKAADRLAFDEK